MLAQGWLGNMRDKTALRWCAVAGGLTVAALGAAVLVPGIPPSPDSSAVTISAWVVSHRTALRAAAILTPFTLFFGVFFLAGLFSLVGNRESLILPLAAVLAGLTTLLLPTVGAIAEAAVAYGAAPLGNVALNRFAFDALSISGVLPFIPAAGMTGAVSLHGRVTGGLPRWLIWLGWIYVPVGVLGAVSAVSDNRAWFLFSAAALGLLALWILATSLAMWQSAAPRSGMSRR
jgi:hypothetical protein